MDKDKSNKMLKTLLNIIITMLVLVIAVIAAYFLYKTVKENNSEETKLAYTDLVKEIQAGNVEKIEMTTGSPKLKVKMFEHQSFLDPQIQE